MSEILAFISGELERLGLDYDFEEWTRETIPDTYWVGEYNEVGDSEDASFETTFILTGTTKGSRLVLEAQKEIIKNEFSDGKTAILESGSGVAVIYLNGFGIPTAVEGMKRVQINLKIKEWKVSEWKQE